MVNYQLYWFCHTSTWICHRYTRVPHPESPSLLPPHTVPLGHLSAPAPSIQYHASNLDWRFVSYVILCMFQCHSPKSSHPLPLPESKRLFYTSVSLLLSWKQPRCPSADEWIRKLWYVDSMKYYAAIKNTLESVLMRWMKLEPIIQSEISQDDIINQTRSQGSIHTLSSKKKLCSLL